MMSTSAHASSSSAKRRFAAAFAAKKVGLFRNSRQPLAMITGSANSDCTQILSIASITKLCASTCACKRCSSLLIAVTLPVNLPDFIVHGAMPLPIAKPSFCLEARFDMAQERFQ